MTLDRQAAGLSVLFRLSRAIASGLDMKQVCQLAVRELNQMVGYGHVSVYLLDGESLQLQSAVGAATVTHRISVYRGALGKAARLRRPILVPDVGLDADYVAAMPDALSQACAPIVFDGDPLGVINAQTRAPHALDGRDLDLLIAVAAQLAVALRNAQLSRSERRSRQVTDILTNVARALGSTLDLDQLLNLILAQMRALIPYDSASIALLDDDGQQYTMRASCGLPESLLRQPLVFDVETTPTARKMVATRQAYRIADTHAEPGWIRLPDFDHIRAWLGAPVLRNERAIGFLMLDHTRPGFFSDEHQRLVEAFAQHAAIAIESARLLDQARRQAACERLVRDVNGKISASIQLDTVMQTAVAELGRALDAARCVIRLGADPGHMPVAYEFEQPGVAPLGAGSLDGPSHLGQVLRERRTIVDREPRLAGGAPALTCLATPIVVRGRTVGALSLECNRPHGGTPDEIVLLEDVSAQLSLAIHNAQLYQEVSHALNDLNLLHKIAMTVASAATLPEAVQRVVESVHAVHRAHVTLLLVDRDTGDLVVGAAVGYAGDLSKFRVKAGQGITGWVARSGRPALVPDTAADRRFIPGSSAETIRSELAVPLIAGSEVVGVLNLESTQTDAFDEADLQLLTTLSGSLATIISNLRLLDEVRAANARLQEMDRLKSQFLANVSHELRTPLNSIIGFSEVLIDGLAGALSAEQLDFVNSIHASGQHLLTLINDVLDLSKIQAGKMKVDCRPIDPRVTAEEACSVIAPLLIKAGQSLTRALEPDLPLVSADAFRFKQVLINLLSNAHKFSPAGSRITLAARRVDSYIHFSVIDQGDGIRPEDHERVFQEFFQIDGDGLREREGTGLGLPITRRLVEMQGGRIWIESEGAPGQGAAFHFSLPVAEVAGLSPALPAIADTPQRRALIVEDDRHLSNLLAVYFSQQGYLPVQHYTGHSVVELARELRPAVITLDLMMPERDGWSALRDLKSAPDTRDVPVIIISALDYTEIGLSQGAAEYLVKPFDPDQLLATLRRIGGVPRRDPLRVLVVDDDPLLNEMLAVMLPQPDYAVASATSGPTALDAIRRVPPDVVILDLLMPVMNGFELLELLRADPATRDLPVIVLTAKPLSETERAQLAAAAQTVLKKNDLSRQQLVGALRRLRLPARSEVEPQEVVA
jgi:GAF domain-containing protein/DNA-binding response OmpR family regulator